MVEPDANSPAGGDLGAPKPKFKTNRVNLMFKAVASDPGSEPTASSDLASSSSASAAAVPATKLTSFSNGVLKLGKKKESSQLTSEGDRSSVETDNKTPPPESGTDTSSSTEQPSNGDNVSSDNDAPAVGAEKGGLEPSRAQTSTTNSAPSTSNTSSTAAEEENPAAAESSKPMESHNSAEPAKVPEIKKQTSNYTQEELSSKGISVAGRFHSSSNENWEDEEDDWAPPVGNAMQEFRRRLSSSKHLPPTFGVGSNSNSSATGASSTSSTTNASSTAANAASLGVDERKPGPPSLNTKSQSPSPSLEGPAWGARTTVPAAKSLSQTIKEAKEKGTSPAVASMNRPTGLGDSRTRTGLSAGPGGLGGSGLAAGGARAANASGGGDALSRFRLQAPVQHMGHGAPPLNPRAFETDFNGPPTFELETPQFNSFPNHHRGPPPLGGFNSFRTFEEPPRGFGRFGGGPPPPGPPPVDSLFMNAKPRRALDEPGPVVPPSRPVLNPRPIPERLRRDVLKPDGLDWQKKPSKPQPAPAPTKEHTEPKESVEADTESKSEAKSEAKPEVTFKGTSEAAPEGTSEAKSDAVPDTHESVAPATTGPAATSDDSPESGTSPEQPAVPEEESKSITEQQHEEMHAMIEQVKARKEAEMKAEKEKQERLAKLREQYRREAEEKRKAEKEAEKSKVNEENEKKNAKKLQLERRRIEMEQRMKLRAEEKAEKERKKAEEAKAREEKAEELHAKETREAKSSELADEEHPVGGAEANESNTLGASASGNRAETTSNEDIAAKTAKIPSRLLKASIPKGPKADTVHEAGPHNTLNEVRSSQAHAENDKIMGIPVPPQPVNALGYPARSKRGKAFLVKLPESDSFSGEVDISDMLAIDTVDCKPSETGTEDFHGNASYRSRYASRKPRGFKKSFKKLN